MRISDWSSDVCSSDLPSQLYEMGLEGFVLFALIWWFARKPRPVGQVSAVFLMGYGTIRFLVEFTRAPDYFLGLLFDGLSMGQLLSLPMIAIGAVIFWVSARKSTRAQIGKEACRERVCKYV